MTKSEGKSKQDAQVSFPPYGNVSREFRLEADSVGVPSRFTVAGRPGSSLEWDRYLWLEATQMGDFLWPVFDRAKGAWTGKSIDNMEALTRADLDLMQTLSGKLGEEAKAAGKGLDRNHLDLFRAEDISARPTLSVYLPSLDDAERSALEGSINQWFGGIADAHVRFKAFFQRPRPYQTAYLLRPGTDYEYRHAASAVTPSMISGHAFQGLVVRCGGYISNRLMLEANLGAVERLQQYAVDVGDRRVFAGVHYPSDNLSSWYCGLRLCDHFFSKAGQAAKDFMWEAIQRSAVYKAMDEAASKSKHSPFTEPLARLIAEAKRKADVNAEVPAA